MAEIEPVYSTDTAKTTAAHVPSHRIRNLALTLLLVVSLSSGFLGGWIGARQAGDKTTVEKQQVVLKTQGQLISKIAKDVGASVVSITATSTGVVTDNFFGTQRSVEQQGAGTGIIISDSGLIMTNRHVVPAGTTAVSVTLSDGTEYDNVEVVGRTSQRDVLDIAFLRIKDTKGKKLTAASIGESAKMQVGDPVVAIGNALGQFENTVTSGILSGHGRSLEASSGDGTESENLEDLFQTDAAINQGNSGGPLVNLDGEIIGINTAVAAGDAQGIGFAIPIDNVKGLVKSVVETGKLQRPYLGVIYVTLTDDTAKQYGLSVQRGAYIAPAAIVGDDPIIAGGPAAKAGLKAGDVITKVNSDEVNEKKSLAALLGKYKPGDAVTLTVLREGKSQTINATLGTAPGE